jgi:hypothetical protein
MRLALYVNDKQIARASLEHIGYLSAHLNLSQGIGPDDESNTVRLVAIDKTDEVNTVFSTWDGPPLSLGDKAELHLLPDGESDVPTMVNRMSESPSNLFSSLEQAQLALLAVKACDVALSGIANRAQESEPEEEQLKIRQAVGEILSDLDRFLISPILRRHPSLLAQAKAAGLN